MTSRFPWQGNYGNVRTFPTISLTDTNLFGCLRERDRERERERDTMIDEIICIQCDLAPVPWETSTAGRPKLGVCTGGINVHTASPFRACPSPLRTAQLYVVPVPWAPQRPTVSCSLLRTRPCHSWASQCSRRFPSLPIPLWATRYSIQTFTGWPLTKSQVRFCWQMTGGDV